MMQQNKDARQVTSGSLSQIFQRALKCWSKRCNFFNWQYERSDFYLIMCKMDFTLIKKLQL